MKKSLLALAVLGAFASAASAQSSVTLFGIVDLSLQEVKNGDNKQKKMASDGINSSRLGFRGVEDLGGGLSAGFWLEAGIDAGVGNVGGNNGTGLAQPTGTSSLFNRRATISLLGRWGELRLGRDYTPGFWNTTVFDPFGTNGVGAFTNISAGLGGVGTNGGNTYVRGNNTIGYFLPGNLGGLYGQAMITPSEGVPGQKLSAFRVGYAAGPVNVAWSWQKTDAGIVLANDWEHQNIAGSWNFGFMNLMGQYDTVKGGPRKANIFLIGTVIPLGQGEVHFSYVDGDQKGGGFDANDADQTAIGYVYNLSKRTAMYGTYSTLSNKGTAALVVSGGPAQKPGGKSSAYEFGVRHAF